MDIQEQTRDGFLISTDPAKLQPDEIFAYLSRSYWAKGRKRETILKSLPRSLCFGLYLDGRQIGFARVVSDFATFAYLCDVYVLEEYQGRGLGKWLVSAVMAHPELQGLRRWMLATRDAHALYRQFGFTELKAPERWMEIVTLPPVPPETAESRSA
jgi:GNAT superfamily N-acetyltransferase